ncbi:MAG: flagellar protein FlhE [Pseudomonadota bacterium]
MNISNFGSGTTDAFAGENPNQSIYMIFFVPGTGTINPVMIGLRNSVTVNWTDSFPQPTEITGPSEVEVAQTIELNGTVNYATIYSWTTAGDCSIPDLTNAATATIRGDRSGFCTVTRVACDDQNKCTSDTHGINVTGQLVLTPILYLLLSK